MAKGAVHSTQFRLFDATLVRRNTAKWNSNFKKKEHTTGHANKSTDRYLPVIRRTIVQDENENIKNTSSAQYLHFLSARLF